MRIVDHLIVHCSATPPGMDIGANEIRGWHVTGNGWSDIGYHYVIRRNGTVEKGRPEDIAGAHAKGYNKHNIGICLVGGIDNVKDKNPVFNYSHQQIKGLDELINKLIVNHPIRAVYGHNDVDPHKQCPCFDVKEFVGEL